MCRGERKIWAAALLVPLAFAASGCASQDVAPEGQQPSVSASTGVPTPDLGDFTPGPTGVVDDDSGEVVEVDPVPTWDEESRAAAAEVVMVAYAQPDLTFEQWWAGVQPLLDQQASTDYAFMDPASIAARQVTGPAVIVDDTSAYVAVVKVPTDAGDYEVVLSRSSGSGLWLTSRFVLPDGLG